MPYTKVELEQRYDRAPGSDYAKALKLIKDYSGTNGYIFSAKTDRFFTGRVAAPYADVIANRLDLYGLGSRIDVACLPLAKNVHALLRAVIGVDIYRDLKEGGELRHIADVILEKNNMSAEEVFPNGHFDQPLLKGMVHY